MTNIKTLNGFNLKKIWLVFRELFMKTKKLLSTVKQKKIKVVKYN